MDITTRTPSSRVWIELNIKDGNTTISADISSGEQESTVEALITAANDISRNFDISDVKFVKEIFDAFLDNREKQEFIDLITTTDENY